MRYIIATMAAAALLGGCVADKEARDVKRAEAAPVNCATAQGDIRMLRSEKANVEEEIAEGVTAIVPIGFLIGVVTETEGDKINMATGDYNRLLDQQIAKIQKKCNVR